MKSIILVGILLVGCVGITNAQHRDYVAMSTVSGFVWTSADTPIADAGIRIRDTRTGQVLVTTTTDKTGYFNVTLTSPATVIVEYVNGNRILGVGFPITVGYGETAITFIRIPVGAAIIPSMSPVVSSVLQAAVQVGIKNIEYVGIPMSAVR